MNKTVSFSEAPVLVRQISDQSEARKENTQTPTERISAKEAYKYYKKKQRKIEARNNREREFQDQLRQSQEKPIEIDTRAEEREAMRLKELHKLYEKSSQQKSKQLQVNPIKLDTRAEAREAMRLEEIYKLNSKDSKCIPGQSCSIMGGKKTKKRTRRIRRTKRTRKTRKTRRTKRT